MLKNLQESFGNWLVSGLKSNKEYLRELRAFFWKKGGPGEILLLSTAPLEQVVARWRLVSFPRNRMTGNSLKSP